MYRNPAPLPRTLNNSVVVGSTVMIISSPPLIGAPFIPKFRFLLGLNHYPQSTLGRFGNLSGFYFIAVVDLCDLDIPEYIFSLLLTLKKTPRL